MEAFDDVELFRMRSAELIHECLRVQSDGINNQRITAFVMSDRIRRTKMASHGRNVCRFI